MTGAASSSERAPASPARAPRMVVVIAPHDELPPGFPFSATELSSTWELLAWIIEHRELSRDSQLPILRLSARLLEEFMRLNDSLEEEERFQLHRFGDLSGPLDGAWTLRANGLRVTAAATLLATRGTDEGEARLGRRGQARRIRPPKDFAKSLSSLSSGVPPAGEQANEDDDGDDVDGGGEA